jgi:deoxyinosine 3'endonuclease (endonuclease V)
MLKGVKKGDYIELKGDSGTIWGVALKSCESSEKPIYVTIGHKINLDTAKNIVLKTCLYKIPEPIRNSDIKSKLYF